LISRRALLLTPAALAADSRFRLIAHRGGVVGPDKAENSRASLEAAIAEGYWMAEIDIRRTKDGEPVLHHDPTFERYYGDPRRPEEMTWNEISALRSRIDGRPPLHLRDACEICAGRMRFMLDLKGRNWPPEFYAGILRRIEEARIPGPIYSLAGPAVRLLFQERVQVSVNRRELEDLAARGEPVADRYFLFLLASEMSKPDVDMAKRLGVAPVAAINTFRYAMAKRDEEAGPAEDASRLIGFGVDCFQIDSRYGKLFRR
jgi:glycerophosphoryl diester phosphodiesterase